MWWRAGVPQGTVGGCLEAQVKLGAGRGFRDSWKQVGSAAVFQGHPLAPSQILTPGDPWWQPGPAAWRRGLQAHLRFRGDKSEPHAPSTFLRAVCLLNFLLSTQLINIGLGGSSSPILKVTQAVWPWGGSWPRDVGGRLTETPLHQPCYCPSPWLLFPDPGPSHTPKEGSGTEELTWGDSPSARCSPRFLQTSWFCLVRLNAAQPRPRTSSAPLRWCY